MNSFKIKSFHRKLLFTLCLFVIANVLPALDIVIQNGFPDRVNTLAVSPDGKLLACSSGDNAIICDPGTGRIIRTIQWNRYLREVFFTSDGKGVVLRSDRGVAFFETATGRRMWHIGGAHFIGGIALHPDGKTIAISKSDTLIDAHIIVFDMISITDVSEIRVLTEEVDKHFGASLAYSPDGKFLAVGNGDAIDLMDSVSGVKIKTFAWHSNYVSTICFSPDGKQLLSGSGDYNLKLWDIALGKEIRTLRGHSYDISSAIFSADGKTIFSIARGEQKLWETATGRELKTFTGRNYSQSVLSSNGRFLFSGTTDSGIYIWDTVLEKEVRVMKSYASEVDSAVYSPDGTLAASCSADGTVVLWDAKSGNRLWNITGSQTFAGSNEVGLVTFSHDGKQMLTTSVDKTIKVRETSTGRELRTITGHTGMIKSVAFNPQGTKILSSSSDSTVKLWDAESGREIKTLTDKLGYYSSAVFNSDGTQIAAYAQVSGKWNLTIWNAETGLELMAVQSNSVYSMAFSPDGMYLITGVNKAVEIWDVKTGTKVKSLAYENTVKSVAISPDGKRIVAAEENGKCWIWDAVSGKVIRELYIAPSSLSFSPDGARILSAGKYGVVTITDTETAIEIARFVNFRGGQWVCIANGGYYNGSAGVEEFLAAWEGEEPCGMEHYPQFKRPDMVAELLKKL